MKSLVLVFSLVVFLTVGCSAESTIFGPEGQPRGLAPAEDCNINTKLC